MSSDTKDAGLVNIDSQDISLGQIGQGGFAVVRQAKVKIGGFSRDVAIKEFKDEPSFIQERDVTFQIQRFPGVLDRSAKLLGQCVTSKQLLYELMPAGSLANWIQQNRNADSRLKLRLLLDACACVQAVHNAGYLHCDLKPHNFLLTTANPVWDQAESIIKLCDFGLARTIDATATAVKSDLVYMAPEVKTGGQFTASADVYSLAIVLFEIWTGHLLTEFPESERQRVLTFNRPNLAPTLVHAYNSFMDPVSNNDSVASAVRDCVAERDPSMRHTAEQLCQAIQKALSAQQGNPYPFLFLGAESCSQILKPSKPASRRRANLTRCNNS